MPETLPVDSRVQRIIRYFEGLTEADLARLGEVYAPEAVFKDPFHEVSGLPSIERVYRHMFHALHGPRFVVTESMLREQTVFLLWDFRFRFGPADARESCVRGCSHLRLDDQGRICAHRDYWDAAEELYEKLPVLGAFMRWLKRRAAG